MPIGNVQIMLRNAAWDRVRVAKFYLKSGAFLRVKPKRDQKLVYNAQADSILCDDDDPSTWVVPVDEIAAAYLTFNEEED